MTVMDLVYKEVSDITCQSDADGNKRREQVITWTEQQNLLKNFRVSRVNGDDEFTYLRSTRRLKAGQILIIEQPLVLFPCLGEESICLGCCKSVNGDIRCETCGWPVCSSACPSIRNHSPECSILKQENSSKLEVRDLPYSYISIFRFMGLKTLKPKVFGKLVSLTNGKNLYHFSRRCKRDLKYTLPVVRRYVTAEEYSDEAVLNICHILRRNIFDKSLCSLGNPYKKRDLNYSAVYRFSSLLDHSCIPNCYFDMKSSGVIIVKALSDIPKSQKLTITYADPFAGSLRRQRQLSEDRFAVCNCIRCLDTTELGSDIRTPMCNLCCHGQLYALCRTKYDTTFWKCNKCQGVSSPSIVGYTTTDLEYKISAKSDLEDCQEFLIDAGMELHANHEILLSAEKLTCLKYIEEHNKRSLTAEETQHFVDLNTHLLAMHEKLIPGKRWMGMFY